MQALLEIDDPSAMQSGLYPSLAPNQQVLWRSGQNVTFKDGKVTKSAGWDRASGTATADTIVALAQSYTDLEKRIYLGTPTRLYKYASGALVSIGSAFTGSRWSLEIWGNNLLATNDVDPPQIWRNGGAVSPMAGMVGYRAKTKIVRKLANHVVHYNTDQDGREVIWSTDDDAETYNVTAENSAGEFTVRDLDGDIAAAEPLGDSLAFYSQDSMGLTTYIGAPYYFSNKVVLNGVGAVGRDVVVSAVEKNYGLSRKGFWQTDGLTYDYIDGPQVNKWFASRVDWVQQESIEGFHNERDQQIEWHFTALDGTRQGLAYGYKTKAWTLLAKPLTAILEQQVFSWPVVAYGTFFGFYGADEDFTTIGTQQASVRTSCQELRNQNVNPYGRNRYKSVEELRVDFEATGEMEFRVGYSLTPKDADVEWQDWEPLVYENFFNRETLFVAFEFRNSAPNVQWSISGFSVHGEPTGYV